MKAFYKGNLTDGELIITPSSNRAFLYGDGLFETMIAHNGSVKFLDEHKISWCNWSVSDKEETASIIKPGARYTGKWKIEDLTPSGQFVREEMIIKNSPLPLIHVYLV